MPRYDYECISCGVFEVSHSISESISLCPKCSKNTVKRVYSPIGISFKGSGFYSTDKNSSPKASNKDF